MPENGQGYAYQNQKNLCDAEVDFWPQQLMVMGQQGFSPQTAHSFSARALGPASNMILAHVGLLSWTCSRRFEVPEGQGKSRLAKEKSSLYNNKSLLNLSGWADH
jgi:hypothetical protein